MLHSLQKSPTLFTKQGNTSPLSVLDDMAALQSPIFATGSTQQKPAESKAAIALKFGSFGRDDTLRPINFVTPVFREEGGDGDGAAGASDGTGGAGDAANDGAGEASSAGEAEGQSSASSNATSESGETSATSESTNTNCDPANTEAIACASPPPDTTTTAPIQSVTITGALPARGGDGLQATDALPDAVTPPPNQTITIIGVSLSRGEPMSFSDMASFVALATPAATLAAYLLGATGALSLGAAGLAVAAALSVIGLTVWGLAYLVDAVWDAYEAQSEPAAETDTPTGTPPSNAWRKLTR